MIVSERFVDLLLLLLLLLMAAAEEPISSKLPFKMARGCSGTPFACSLRQVHSSATCQLQKSKHD
jgi:hypothetical protein